MFRNILLTILLIIFPLKLYSQDICFSKEDASKIIVELEQKVILEEEIKQYENLIQNLKKQNELLQEQNKLLRERIDLYKNQAELYKQAYIEEKNKKNLTFFNKLKYIGQGIITGALIGLLISL